MKQTILAIMFLLFLFSAQGTNCVIHGNAGTYAGETLYLSTYSDYITKTKKNIAESKVDDEGYFSFTVESNECFEAFIDLDVFVGYIIVEPGKRFNVVLPQKTVRHHQDIMNPYFKPFEFYLRILNDDDNVTVVLKKFDALYAEVVRKIFKDPGHINPGLVETEIQSLDEKTAFCKNAFFADYKKYKFLELRLDAIYKNKKAVIRKNFNPEPVLFKNPAYNKLLKDKLGNVLLEAHGDEIMKMLSDNSGWNMMDRTLAKYDMCSNPEFREYYLFVNLYQEFYKNTIFKNNILDALYSSKEFIKNKHTLKAIENFLENAKNLIAGNASLDFRLSDIQTYMHSLSDFQGKFVYLGFYSTESYPCKKDILLLQSLAEKDKKMLKIILIFKEQSPLIIKNFIEDAKLENILVLRADDNEKIIKEYNVKAFPTYYLINPEGKLSLISAPGPAEDFSAVYQKIRQGWRIKQMQKAN